MIASKPESILEVIIEKCFGMIFLIRGKPQLSKGVFSSSARPALSDMKIVQRKLPLRYLCHFFAIIFFWILGNFTRSESRKFYLKKHTSLKLCFGKIEKIQSIIRNVVLAPGLETTKSLWMFNGIFEFILWIFILLNKYSIYIKFLEE